MSRSRKTASNNSDVPIRKLQNLYGGVKINLATRKFNLCSQNKQPAFLDLISLIDRKQKYAFIGKLLVLAESEILRPKKKIQTSQTARSINLQDVGPLFLLSDKKLQICSSNNIALIRGADLIG